MLAFPHCINLDSKLHLNKNRFGQGAEVEHYQKNCDLITKINRFFHIKLIKWKDLDKINTIGMVREQDVNRFKIQISKRLDWPYDTYDLKFNITTII